MPKATIQNVKDEGFRTDQFSALAVDFDAFLQGPVDEAGRWAKAKLGAAMYDAQTASSYAFDLLKRAEVCFVAAQLWKRRAGFVDSNAQIGRESPQYLERREYLAHSDRAMECANAALAEVMRLLGLDPGELSGVPGMVSGYIETGRYPQTSAEALNA